MIKDTLERPSFRSLQVASCRDGVNWKGGKTYRKANVTKGDSLDNVIRYVHIAIAALALSGLSQLTTLYRTIIIGDHGLPIHFADVNVIHVADFSW